MADKKILIGTILIIGLVVIRGLLYGLVIPFDQAPDESHHFKLVKAKQLQLAHASEEEWLEVAAQERLAWCYLVSPETCPQRASVENFRGARLPESSSSFDELYYLMSGWLLKTLSLRRIQDEVYLLRGLSILCGALVVFIAAGVARELFPGNRLLQLGVPAFIAFIPQFSAMNGAINNDKLAEVFLAGLCWLMVKIFKHGLKFGYACGYIAFMAIAIFSKRATMFTIPVFFIMLFVYFWKSSLGLKMHLILLGSLILAMLGGYGALWNDAVHTFIKIHIIWLPVVQRVEYFFRPDLYSIAALKYYVKFLIVLYWSFWGTFGYMTVHLHHFWYLLLAAAQSCSLVGLFRFVWRVNSGKASIERWKAKVFYLFAVSIVFMIVTMFLRSIVLRDAPFLEQGRRLFTVILPISILTMFGIEQLFAPKYYRLLAVIGLCGGVLLDVVCLSNYILLNFHRMALF